MLSSKDVRLVYETLLSSPGMLDTIKISLQLSRKNVLLLSKVIDQGITTTMEGEVHSVLHILSEPDKQELLDVGEELLEKGGLTSLNQKLNGLSVK